MKYPLTVLIVLAGHCTYSFAADEESDWGVWATGTVDFSEQHEEIVVEALEEAAIGAVVAPVEEAKILDGRDSIEINLAGQTFTTGLQGPNDVRALIVNSVDVIPVTHEASDIAAVYGSGISGSDENLLHELDKSSLLDYETRTDNNDLQTVAEEPNDLGVVTQSLDAAIEDTDLVEDLVD